ncbi:hypothetical protein BDZ85DRAFT_229709 [Elsinoe ampelina]|uniref:Protein HRI1 n=1 Tax=Elsinoe ampelina TaxID=302913 RepID=A0A6A6GKX0_9PEZI|nr:hypothetical protein BDZ85DRAFT_229709 [Elsinoe ampelina]
MAETESPPSEPFISHRDYIHWSSDPTASEPTSTLVLTTRTRRFIDIRIHKPKPGEPDLPNEGGPLSRLQWSFAGRAHTSLRPAPRGFPLPTSTILHCTWHHWIDSHAPAYRDTDVSDSGDLFPQPDGRTLEKGTMCNPATGREEGYEEMWRDEDVSPVGKEGGKKAVVLELSERDGEGREWARGMVVRVGRWAQGMVKVATEVSCERWEWNEGKGWERKVKVGRLWLPCCVAWEEGVEVGKEVRYGEWRWVVREVDVW